MLRLRVFERDFSHAFSTTDISYCVADLEDAVEKRIFSVEGLYQHLYDAWGNHEKGSLFSQVATWENKDPFSWLPQAS